MRRFITSPSNLGLLLQLFIAVVVCEILEVLF